MTVEELDLAREKVIRAYFPTSPDVWDDVAKNAARAIREGDAARGLRVVPVDILAELYHEGFELLNPTTAKKIKDILGASPFALEDGT